MRPQVRPIWPDRIVSKECQVDTVHISVAIPVTRTCPVFGYNWKCINEEVIDYGSVGGACGVRGVDADGADVKDFVEAGGRVPDGAVGRVTNGPVVTRTGYA